MQRVWLLLLAGCVAFGLNWIARGADQSAVSYERDVWPVLEQTCLRCHSEKKKDGGLNMSTRALMLKGGHSGPAFVPGDIRRSLMLELLEFDEMPPRKEMPRVTKEQLQTLRNWVAAGAPAPAETPAAP
jgi:hypothetical protein